MRILAFALQILSALSSADTTHYPISHKRRHPQLPETPIAWFIIYMQDNQDRNPENTL